MLSKISLKSTATVLGMASLLTICTASFSQLSQAQTPSDSNSDSLVDAIPDRRKGGASRRPQTQETTNDEVVEAPERRTPGGSRPTENKCDFNPQELTALIPRNLVSVTATANPTLFVSVPAISQGTNLELVLRGPNDELIYKKDFQSKGQEGIMNLQLPPLAPVSGGEDSALYHWYLSVICNQSDRAYDLVVEGLIKPVPLDPALAKKIAQATSTEQIKLYQDYNLWNETLNTLASLKQSRPQDPSILALWEDLLESVDLDRAIAQKPLLDP